MLSPICLFFFFFLLNIGIDPNIKGTYDSFVVGLVPIVDVKEYEKF